MSQIVQLYRGSKSQSLQKSYDFSKLSDYGAGKKHSKQDCDRIMHAMLYQHIFKEESRENAGGFSTEYLERGLKADAVERGTFIFLVEFQVARKYVKPKKPLETNTGKNQNRKRTSSKSLAVQEKEKKDTGAIFEIEDDEDVQQTSCIPVTKSKEKTVLLGLGGI